MQSRQFSKVRRTRKISAGVLTHGKDIWHRTSCYVDNICEKLSPPEFILCISHPHLSLLCGNFLFLSNVFFFSLLLYFLAEYLFEYSDYFYIYCYILSFLYNIICFLEYKKVNRFVDFFVQKCRFIILHKTSVSFFLM